MGAALEQDRLTPAAPSWSSAERTRAGSFSPVATITSAPWVSSASVAVRGAALDTTTVSGSSRAPRTSCEDSGSRASESNTILRGCPETPLDACRELRVVRECGADPDGDRVALGPPLVREPRLSSPEIHFESPRWVATLPSSVIADLNRIQGRPVRACLRNDWFWSFARAARSPSTSTTSTPSSRRIPNPRPEACSLGSSARPPPGRSPRRGSPRCRTGASAVAARLERHVQRRPAKV